MRIVSQAARLQCRADVRRVAPLGAAARDTARYEGEGAATYAAGRAGRLSACHDLPGRQHRADEREEDQSLVALQHADDRVLFFLLALDHLHADRFTPLDRFAHAAFERLQRRWLLARDR